LAVSAIGKVQAFNASAESIRGTVHDAASEDEEISPVASVRKPGATSRHRKPPITIDLRPDPPEETPYKARDRVFERAGSDGRHGESARRRGPPEAAPEPPWTYRANPDTPYRRRTSDETYQAVEAVDAPVPHRGGIYDRQV
jgi:hypothetical protein